MSRRAQFWSLYDYDQKLWLRQADRNERLYTRDKTKPRVRLSRKEAFAKAAAYLGLFDIRPRPFLARVRPVKKQNPTPAPKERPEYLTLRGAYDYLGGSVSLSTLRWWIKLRKLTSYKPGKQVLVRAVELDGMINASRRV